MHRGSVGGRLRTSIAGPRLGGRTSSAAAATPGFTTPNTSSTSGEGGPIRRRSYLPRLNAGPGSAVKAGGSVKQVRPPRRSNAENTAVGGVRGRTSLAGIGRPGSSRQSVAAGGAGTSRQSTVGGAAGGAGSNSSRTTPSRSHLTVANYIHPGSAQSNRLSCESRLSTSGRRKQQEVRPISDPAFKKMCIDNIFNFLTENGYTSQHTNLLNRKTVSHPTTKDFTSIFSFIYSKLDKNYKLPARFDEEIPKKLKELQYPTKIPKSTFITVGSPHSWPVLLAMLSFLCDIVTNLASTGPEEMAFPPDFEDSYNYLEDITIFRDMLFNQPEEVQEEQLKFYEEDLDREFGVDEGTLRRSREAAEDGLGELAKFEQMLEEKKDRVAALQRSNTQMKIDGVKLDDYVKALKLRLQQQLQDEPQQLEKELAAKQQQIEQVQQQVNELATLKASQSFTATELYSIKNHAQTSAASLQQLQLQGKETQEKIWEVEVKQCRIQVKLSKHIQVYNSSHAASIVGTIGGGSSLATEAAGGTANTSANASSSSGGGSLPQGAGGVAARLDEQELQQLSARLYEELRVARTRVMQAHAKCSAQEEQCRRWEEQAEEKSHHAAQQEMRIANLEEDIAFTRQEIETEEAVMMQQLEKCQVAVSEQRRAPRTELYTKQQQLVTLKQRLEQKQDELKRRTVEVVAFLSRVNQKITEQLQWETDTAKQFRADIAAADKAASL